MKKRKIITTLLSLVFAGAACFGCGGAKVSGFELGAFKNDQADGSFDSKYFYRNDLDVFGGDADIEWVPDDPLVHMRECVAGQGVLDYDTYLKRIRPARAGQHPQRGHGTQKPRP